MKLTPALKQFGGAFLIYVGTGLYYLYGFQHFLAFVVGVIATTFGIQVVRASAVEKYIQQQEAKCPIQPN